MCSAYGGGLRTFPSSALPYFSPPYVQLWLISVCPLPLLLVIFQLLLTLLPLCPRLDFDVSLNLPFQLRLCPCPAITTDNLLQPPNPGCSYVLEPHITTQPRPLAPPFMVSAGLAECPHPHLQSFQVSLASPSLQLHKVTIPNSSELWAHFHLACFQQTTSSPLTEHRWVSGGNSAPCLCTRKDTSSPTSEGSPSVYFRILLFPFPLEHSLINHHPFNFLSTDFINSFI